MNMYDAFAYVDLSVTHSVPNWMRREHFQKIEGSEKKSKKNKKLKLKKKR